MVKKLVYTIFATVATSVMTMTLLWSVASGPAVALTTREAPVQQTRVHRIVDTGKEMQRRLDERLGSARADEEEKPVQVKKQPQQKMIKYSAKNYIFSDSLTSISPLEREFDDVLWHSLGNRQAIQRKIFASVGGGLVLVGVGKAGLEGFDRFQKRQDRKDIEEELKNTGRYVSVDASNVTTFVNAVTGKERKVKETNKKNQPIKGSLVIHYEIPKAGGGLARNIRKKVEDKEFATKYIDTLQATFMEVQQENKNKKSEAGKDEFTSMKILEGFEGLVSMKIPMVQAPTKQGGVIKGRVYFTEFKKKDMDTILRGYGNAGSREAIREAFGGALSEVFGIEDRARGKVMIMNIVQNRDPEFGEGGRMKNRAVRQLLSNAAPWFLRWIESTDAAGDDGFWETDVMQSVYEDKKISQKKEDDKKDTEF
jgi:DNA-dependent RNA polymerase auxiliary subunit epsilon